MSTPRPPAPHRRRPRRLRAGRRRRARRRAEHDDDRHGRCGGDGAAVHRAGRGRVGDGARHRQHPRGGAAVPEIKQRMLDAGCTAPLIGDFHYNGHLLLTRYPGRGAGARQVPHQSRQRRHRQAARRAVRDDLQGRGRSREAGAHRRQRRLAQPGAGRRARCRRTRTRRSASRPRKSSTSAWCCRRCSRPTSRSSPASGAIRSSSRARSRGRAI